VLNQGKIVQVGTPHEIYSRPKNTFVASFVGSPTMNLIPAEVSGDRLVAMSGKLQLPAPRQNGRKTITIGIRSQDIREGPQEPLVGETEEWDGRSGWARALMITRIAGGNGSSAFGSRIRRSDRPCPRGSHSRSIPP